MTYRDRCEHCGVELSGGDLAFVCSYDCTFCPDCASGPQPTCPNCTGELVRRPRRPAPATDAPGGGSRTDSAGRGAELVIERGGPRDLEALGWLFDLYRQFYRQPPDALGCREFLAERLRRSESIVYLARFAGEPVGFMQLYPLFSSVARKRLWVLNDLYVLPDRRRRGIGRRLLGEAKELARRTDAEGILLDTAVDNPAQQLYESEGWQRDRQFLHYEWLTAAEPGPRFVRSAESKG